MIAGIIVGGSLLFAASLLLAWLLSPGVRVWLEAPKHRFQARLRDHDRRSAYPVAGGERPR